MPEREVRRETVDAECTACGATGLYVGFAEPKGTAVVCVQCNGSGCKTIGYRPFVKRKGRRGVLTVRHSCGLFVATGVGATGEFITYETFQREGMPY